jgi:hypothetical protein
MSPLERNLGELQRLRAAIEKGEVINWKQEDDLAQIDDMIAEAYYTQEAIERTKEADRRLENLNG